MLQLQIFQSNTVAQWHVRYIKAITFSWASSALASFHESIAEMKNIGDKHSNRYQQNSQGFLEWYNIYHKLYDPPANSWCM